MRRSTVVSLPLQIVLPASSIAIVATGFYAGDYSTMYKSLQAIIEPWQSQANKTSLKDTMTITLLIALINTTLFK
jgi:hypothetical protein